MSNFNLRGIPSDVMMLLKREAKELHISVNLLILTLIEKGIGYTEQVKRTKYHDLDHFAGTWSKEDAAIFEKNISYFEKIDEDLWK